MIKHFIEEWECEAILIQDLAELPPWYSSKFLYLDVETTSQKDKEASTNPWFNCKLLGVAVLIDDAVDPIYIPLRHRAQSDLKNLDYDSVMEWIRNVMKGTMFWVNHNIKYDAHVLANEGIDYRDYGIKLIDTLVMAKLAPFEERFNYNLTDIMNEWLHIDIEPYELRIKQCLDRGVKDYGLIPMDLMSPYSCVDVLCVRELYKQFEYLIDEECTDVKELEKSVTEVLFSIEREGMILNTQLLNAHSIYLPYTLQYVLGKQIEEIVGIPGFRPHVNGDCASYFINKLGLPVLEETENDKPSFGEHALLAYKAQNPSLTTVVDLILEYKEKYKLYSSFTSPYLELNINGKVHCDYNQLVRSGRMSCRNPNMQQLSPEAKEYIMAPEGWAIVDIDFSQIEFRLIAHFIQAQAIIDEYNKDPMADYHKLVAKLCGIDRKPAKTMNFMLAYGGGRGKCVQVLSSIPEVIGELKDSSVIEKHANNVYEKYHQMVPTLKNTIWRASQVMRQRGYIKTLFRRHRHLPKKAHFKAFNSVVQGSAADLFKAALVRLYNFCKDRDDVKIVGCVHDSFVLYVRKEKLSIVTSLVKIVEELPDGISVRVPIRAEAKISDTTWKECK